MSDDLISRQVAIDAIRKIPVLILPGGVLLGDVLGTIRQLPSAQPEIICCKDCKHREYYRKSGYMCRLDTGDPYMTGRNAEDDDWFCADAEMR